MTTLAAPAVGRPGTSYYVPGVRILKLRATPARDGESDPGRPLEADVLGDVLQVQVTRQSSGPSLYKLTLNNWYLSTALDRARDPGGTSRESIAGSSPTWPRFKYNDFSLLAFGDRLRIDMRYMPEPVDDTSGRHLNTSPGWVPMVAGPICDMRFAFGASEGARLEISGEDDLSMLQEKFSNETRLDGRSEVRIVEEALKRAEFPLTRIAAPLVACPAFVTDDSQGLQESRQGGQSFLELVQKLADRLDFEVFLEFASLDDPASPQEFHFEPCRARALDLGFRFDRERDLLGFTPTIKVVDQYSEVRVEGRHRDARIPEAVAGKAQHTLIRDELHGSAALRSAGEVREHFFKGRRGNRFKIPNQSNLDPVRADAYALAVIRRKAREFFTIEAATLGQPRLRPGQHVEITGMRPPFDGFYYVTRVVTTFGTDGLRTQFTAARPGMELPPYTAPAGRPS